MKDSYYITTPIYYANDVLHIGHTYTTVAADIITRWKKNSVNNVFFLTGSDEHGSKICEAAKEKNKEPLAYCNEIVDSFKNTWQQLNIEYTSFIRTTDTVHILTVEKFIQALYDNGDIYKSNYEGLYCVPCEKFLSPTELVNDLCPDHNTKPVKQCEENYFFRLSKYRDQLIELITNKNHLQHFDILPEQRRNEVLGKLKLGLDDISISRTNLPWAIPLPFDKSQTIYVWIDALLNYISAIGYADDSEKTQFKKFWPADVHLLAKDILWFHSVIWPAMLLALKLPLPAKVFSHGFFTVEGQKMSKTIGNVLHAEDLVKIYGVDATRFLLLTAFPFGSDGDISLALFKEKYNAHLANNIGNFVSRVTNMAQKYFNGKVTIPENWPDPEITEILKILEPADTHISNVRVDSFIEIMISLSSWGNLYIDKNAPWQLAKTDMKALEKVLYNALIIIKYIAVLSSAVMPESAVKIWKTIDEKQDIQECARNLAKLSPLTGSNVNKPEILFLKIL